MKSGISQNLCWHSQSKSSNIIILGNEVFSRSSNDIIGVVLLGVFFHVLSRGGRKAGLWHVVKCVIHYQTLGTSLFSVCV